MAAPKRIRHQRQCWGLGLATEPPPQSLLCPSFAFADQRIQCILKNLTERCSVFRRDGYEGCFDVGPYLGVELRVAPGAVIVPLRNRGANCIAVGKSCRSRNSPHLLYRG